MTKRRQLTLKERYHISWLLEAGYNRQEIAEELMRSPSTISRELRRNSRANTYDPDEAHYLADVRKILSRKARVITEDVEKLIEDMLDLGLVPEQISATLKKYYDIQVSTTSIYNYIHHPIERRDHLARKLPRYKASKSRLYKKTIERKVGDNRVSIEHRAEEAENRSRTGDLEIDTILSKGAKGGALVICDRKARYTWAARVPDLKPSTINTALLKILEPIKDRIHSITSDNGFEFKDWEEIKAKLDCEYYFCHPYSSWERGTVENTNGLIRRDFPKGTNFSLVDEKYFQFRIGLMNQRVRKCIDFKTPDEEFFYRESFWDMQKRLRSKV